MPSTKDFEKKHGQKKSVQQKPQPENDRKQSKRRPGRDEEVLTSDADVKVVEVEALPSEQQEPHESHESLEPPQQKPKVEINFAGSEMLRAQFPKSFEIAEKVASDWVHNGNFEALPIGHPLAQVAVQKGLQKAKQIEKKVLESPMTEKVAMQVLTAGMKAQSLVGEIRNKIKKK